MTIGEVARRAGLQASAIRYYEKIGLLPKTQRIGGQRRYEPGVLNYLEVIDVAKRAGFRMDEIRHLFHGFGKGIPAFRRLAITHAAQDNRNGRSDRESEENETPARKSGPLSMSCSGGL